MSADRPERVEVKRVGGPGQVAVATQRTGCGWIILKWIGSAAAIYLTAWLLHPYVDVASFGRALVVALVLGLLNALVRPLLIVLTLPITLLTLGLFLIVINALMLQLTAWLLEGFNIAHFGWAALAAVIIAAVNLLIDAFLQGLAGRPRR